MAKTLIESMYHSLAAKEFASHAARAKYNEVIFADSPELLGKGKRSAELLDIALEHERMAQMEPPPPTKPKLEIPYDDIQDLAAHCNDHQVPASVRLAARAVQDWLTLPDEAKG